MADDAASFRTDIVATSFGLTSSMLPTMPSITTSGEELLSVPMPRMVTAAWVGAGLTRRLHGQQARRDALKTRRNVGEGAFFARLLEIDRGDGSRHVGFLLDAVGHDDDLFQSVLLLGEDDVDHRAVADPDTPGLVARNENFSTSSGDCTTIE